MSECDEKQLLRECDLEWYSGSGPGGQRRNKVKCCLRLKHRPSGIVVSATGTYRHVNQRDALKELKRRLIAASDAKAAALKKSKRDAKIREHRVVRTYDFSSGVVKDHRTGRKAQIRKVMRGDLDDFIG